MEQGGYSGAEEAAEGGMMGYATTTSTTGDYIVWLTWWEQICCPHCGLVQYAQVERRPDEVFPRYVHQCACGYIITESDWETLEAVAQ